MKHIYGYLLFGALAKRKKQTVFFSYTLGTGTSDDQRMGWMQLLAVDAKADDQGQAKYAVIFSFRGFVNYKPTGVTCIRFLFGFLSSPLIRSCCSSLCFYYPICSIDKIDQIAWLTFSCFWFYLTGRVYNFSFSFYEFSFSFAI